MKTFIRLALVMFGIVSCGETPPQPAPGQLITSTQQRITDAAPSADVEAAVDGMISFAFDAYRLLPVGQNTAFSPHSVDVALSMVLAGAKGDTLTALQNALHAKLPLAQYHRAMNTIDAQLMSRGRGAAGKDGRPFRLSINNQLFGNLEQHFEKTFLDVLAGEYGAGMRTLDFAKQPEPSRKSINDWVSNNTEKLIPELLKPGKITRDTVLALVNTMYFNAAWKTKFNRDSTAPAPFLLADGTQASVPTMSHQEMPMKYAKDGELDIVELPYQGDEVSMVILATAKGQLESFEKSLDGPKLRALLAKMENRTAALKLPKFEARSSTDLKEVLTGLGWGIAFSDTADFSGMTGKDELQLDSVVHEAVVKTDEDGTEAAAATAATFTRTSLPQFIEINRPFIYLIRDQATQAVLFIGRISKP